MYKKPEIAFPSLNKDPPDKQEKATLTVLQQVEVLCAEWVA